MDPFDVSYIPYIPYCDDDITDEPTVIIDESVVHDNIRECFMAFSDTGEGTYNVEEAIETCQDNLYSELFDDTVMYCMAKDKENDSVRISPIPFDHKYPQQIHPYFTN